MKIPKKLFKFLDSLGTGSAAISFFVLIAAFFSIFSYGVEYNSLHDYFNGRISPEFFGEDIVIDSIFYFLASVFTGLFQFGFLRNKEEVTFMLSRAVKRKRILYMRFITGLIVLLFCAAVPAATDALAVKAFCKKAIFPFETSALIIASRFQIILTGYLSAAVSSFVCGNRLVSSALGVSLPFLPCGVLRILNYCIYGVTGNLNISTETHTESATFLKRASDFCNPLCNLSLNDAKDYDLNIISVKGYDFNNKSFTGFLTFALIWIAVTLLLSALFLFAANKKNLLEKSAFTDNKKNLTLFAFPVISVFVCCIITRFFNTEVGTDNKESLFILFAILIIYLLTVNIIHTVKNGFSKSVVFGAALSLFVPIVGIVIGLSGIYPFGKTVPEKPETDKAVVIFESSEYFLPMLTEVPDFTYTGFDSEVFSETEAEKNLVFDLQKSAINSDDTKTDISFTVGYFMKNGGYIEYTYKDISESTCKKLLKVRKFKDAERIVNWEFDMTDTETAKPEPEDFYIKSRDCKTLLHSGDLENEKKEIFWETFYKEYNELTEEELYFPKEPSLCSVVYKYGVTDYRDASEKNTGDLWFFRATCFEVYPSMKETVKLIKEYGFGEALKNSKPEKLYLLTEKEFEVYKEYEDEKLNNVFTSGYYADGIKRRESVDGKYNFPFFEDRGYYYINDTDLNNYENYGKYDSNSDNEADTEKEQINGKQINTNLFFKNCYSTYFVYGKRYYAVAEFDDGSFVTYCYKP